MIGVKRSGPGATHWTPFDDQETALHAEIEDVIFGESLAECVGQLEAKYPASDPRLTRIFETSHGQYIGGRWHNKPQIIVREVDDQVYAGGDPVEALALVKEFGSIHCDRLYDNRNDDEEPAVDWQKEGVVVNRCVRRYRWTQINHLKYNPKGVARAAKAAKTRAKNQPVLCCDVSQCFWKLRNLVRSYIPSLSYESPNGRYSRYSVAWTFLETIKYFSFVFGKGAYRRHPAFRELKKKWKAREDRSRKAFLKGDDYSDIIIRFVNFMDAEVRIRNGTLITTDRGWKPRGEFPTFDEYREGPYDKVIARRKRAEAKAAKVKAKAKAAADKAKAKGRGAKPKAKKAGGRTRNRAHAAVQKV